MSINCLLSLFYIKPQQQSSGWKFGFIVFYLFSTSNHNQCPSFLRHHQIVFYLFSTSNHNRGTTGKSNSRIVFYLFSTSNHNTSDVAIQQLQLSFISFLHQTTTDGQVHCMLHYCLLSLFYIKPQLLWFLFLHHTIVFYLFSTSNHNLPPKLSRTRSIVFYLFSTSNHNLSPNRCQLPPLSFISFLHQTTTWAACFSLLS